MLTANPSSLRLAFFTQDLALEVVLLVDGGEDVLSGDAREAIRAPVLVIQMLVLAWRLVRIGSSSRMAHA